MMIRIVLLISVLLAGCATSTLETKILPSDLHDVSDYKTYRWGDRPVTLMGVLTGANINELQTRIKQAVDQGLARRGYRLVAKTAPHDMEVTAMVSASNEIQYSEHAVTSNRAYQTTVAWSQLNDYLKGALLIILTEPESRDIIWRGTASENLKNNSNRNEGTVEKFTNLITDQLPMSSRP